jgi:hypothetical protein
MTGSYIVLSYYNRFWFEIWYEWNDKVSCRICVFLEPRIFSTTPYTNDRNDKQTFNTFCINLHLISLQLNLMSIQCFWNWLQFQWVWIPSNAFKFNSIQFDSIWTPFIWIRFKLHAALSFKPNLHFCFHHLIVNVMLVHTSTEHMCWNHHVQL